VQPGDTLAGIAGRYNTTGDIVCLFNELPDCSVIHPGQELLIPGEGEVVASPTTLAPSATPRPLTPTPKVDSRDAAFVLALDNLMTSQGATVVDVLQDIAEASQRVDVIKLCQAADDLVAACVVFSVEMEALPSPVHSYLTSSYACLERAGNKFGAVGLAIQAFCDTGDTLTLYAAIEGMNQGAEQLTCATEWLDKYREEIQ